MITGLLKKTIEMNFKFKITEDNQLDFFVEHYKMLKKHVGNHKLVLYKSNYGTYALSYNIMVEETGLEFLLFFCYDFRTRDLGLFTNPASHGYSEIDNTEFNLLVLEKMDND